jgi:methylated-DNA-protein-cysteine methyltransferase-like protein
VKRTTTSAGKIKRKTEPTPIFARVHALVKEIPRRHVATYGQLSELIGGRLTPVGIGWALHGCPRGVPWHRVINSKGGISTDRELPGVQRKLLEKEGVRFRSDGTVDLARYRWAGR